MLAMLCQWATVSVCPFFFSIFSSMVFLLCILRTQNPRVVPQSVRDTQRDWFTKWDTEQLVLLLHLSCVVRLSGFFYCGEVKILSLNSQHAALNRSFVRSLARSFVRE